MFQSNIQQIEVQNYFDSQQLIDKEQQAMQQNSIESNLTWECGWCMPEHTPGATTGICSDCEKKFFSR